MSINNMKGVERLCNDIINEAPTFKELLWAIMDEKRDQLLSTDLYKFIEKRIKEKCEEAALNLKSSIKFEELGFHNCDQFFKNMTRGGYNSGAILEMVRCACEKLDLKFSGQVICWGRTSVSPEE